MDLTKCASAGSKAGGFALVPGHINSKNHQSLSNISAHDSSRLHFGNNYYVTYTCSSSHGSIQPLSSETRESEDVARASQKRKRPTDDCEDAAHHTSPRQSLAVVLESLGGYSKSMQQLKEGDKGKEIAAQLQFLLASLSQAKQGNEASEELDKEVQKLQHQLQGARRIKINGASPKPMVSEVRKAHSTYFCVTIGHWRISLTTKTLTSRAAHGLNMLETCSALNVQHLSKGSGISAFFGERDNIDHVTTLCPAVTAYNQVSNDSEVFRIVEQDSLDDLLRMLAIGEASIRDCDEEGRSLLLYACIHASANICKYLVESGADVDRRGPHIFYPKSSYTPLSVCYLHAESGESKLESSLRCGKLLLQAGADPTLLTREPGDFKASPLYRSVKITGRLLETGTIEPFVQILQESMPYFDLRTFREDGKSIWQTACRSPPLVASYELLPLLANAGVDVEETNEFGQSCLFECALHVQLPERSAEFTALCSLLTVFDKIHAQDSFGKTVSDYLPWDGVFERRLGSYRHDLWYCALHRSGLARRFEISPPLSKIVFTKRYTVKTYRALLYLDHWDLRYPGSIPHPLAQNFPSSGEERQRAPAFQQWDLSDLLMMEQRALSKATCVDRSHMLYEDSSSHLSDTSEDESSSQFSDTAEEDWTEGTED